LFRQILILVAFLLAGCGGGYASPQAVTRIEFGSISEVDAASDEIQNALRDRGFQLEPRRPFPEELTEAWSPAMKWRDQHEVSLALNRSGGEDLVAYVTPFPSAETFWDVPEQSRFPILEVRLVELRPGGFSPEGHRVHKELLSFLREQGYRPVVMSEPPPTDDDEHARVKFDGLVSSVLSWMSAWALGIVTVGALANWIAKRTGAQQWIRRAIFVTVGVVLITPLPYPAALAVIPLPGLLWLFSDPATYARFMAEWAVSGTMSGTLSALVAILLVRDRRRFTPAQEEPVP
jgi:hypothetical protein